ncbi:MAG: hypothetical protein K0A98_02890 [Trueperaceae bacterium]|nr:hypothetical protein [Trueperaceae bacterium]
MEPAAFDSGNRLRDGRARASVCETDAFPESLLLAEADFEVSLTAHGMRRPALLGLVTDDLVQVSLVATARPDPVPSPTTR